MGSKYCICFNPPITPGNEVNYENASETKNIGDSNYEKWRINESKNELVNTEQEKVKGRFHDHVTVKSIKSNNDFDERYRPGLEITPGQMKLTTTQKVIDIEKKLGPFELTSEEKEFCADPKLRKFTILYSDNKIYDSQYNSSWEKEGHGCLYLPDGSKFEGIYKKGKMVRGRLINKEGDYYEGK